MHHHNVHQLGEHGRRRLRERPKSFAGFDLRRLASTQYRPPPQTAERPTVRAPSRLFTFFPPQTPQNQRFPGATAAFVCQYYYALRTAGRNGAVVLGRGDGGTSLQAPPPPLESGLLAWALRRGRLVTSLAEARRRLDGAVCRSWYLIFFTAGQCQRVATGQLPYLASTRFICVRALCPSDPLCHARDASVRYLDHRRGGIGPLCACPGRWAGAGSAGAYHVWWVLPCWTDLAGIRRR